MAEYPGTLNLEVRAGQTFRKTFTWEISDTPVNLTGYTGSFAIGFPTPHLVTPTLGGSAGTIEVVIADDVTADFAVGGYPWDLIMISGGGETTPLLAGVFQVRGLVPRD